MQSEETLKDFYTRNPAANPFGLSLTNAGGLGHFNVFTRQNCVMSSPYRRRDFYKISLIIGTGKLFYADKWIEVNRPALLFSNPTRPYAWEPISQSQEGYFCLFTESFWASNYNDLAQFPFFKVGGQPLYFVDQQQQDFISGLFQQMLQEINTDYAYKFDLLRSYVHLIMHQVLKMQPTQEYKTHISAAGRITELFLELLERQFPVDGQEHSLQLKTATDFAHHLSVHVNHLNRSVKEITGKTTTQHISERIIREAKILLAHSDWNIAEIAYSLGFEYPTYFNNFFKRQTQTTPQALRRVPV
jgi:AraC family transcriptional regulator, transcriptional activator of pobA